tara:strand:+ start:367 stop:2874 length:2508 start_codon:yes stop_codon:yes gene_type:complete
MKDYFFPLEVTSKIKENIGFKSYYLSSLDKLEIPTVSRVLVSDQFYKDYLNNDCLLNLDKLKEIIDKVLENSKSGLKSPDKPLIISIRPSKNGDILKLNSVLNIGFNKDTVEQLGTFYLRPKFAHESYYLFICNFLQEVFNVSKLQILNIENRFIDSKKLKKFRDLKLNDIKELIDILLNFANQNNFKIPYSIYEQAGMVIESMYTKWLSKEFKDQKIKENFSLKKGLPLIIEEMTFGNLGENSGSFVAYSRDPNTGEKGIKGDYFQSKQNFANFRFNSEFKDISNLDKKFLDEIKEYLETLESFIKFDLCVEGVIEDGSLRITNLYEIPKTIQAEVKICNDFLKEEKLEFSKAVNFINSEKLHLYQNLECQSSITDFSFAKGKLMTIGACIGKLVFDIQEAKNCILNKQNFILFSKTNYKWPKDIIKRASGLILDNKQFTSVLARETRELCIPTIAIDDFISIKNKQIIFENQKILKSGDLITLDANTGRIFKTKKKLIPNEAVSPLKDLIRESKDHLSLDFYSFGKKSNYQESFVETYLWDTEEIIKESIDDLDKLRILFKNIQPRDLIKIKNNLRDRIEDKIETINQKNLQIAFPYDIIGSLIPKIDSILDFVEISKLDYDYAQQEILKLISLSKNSIAGSKIFINNENLFALIIQSFLEAMWRVQTKRDITYNFILSNINSPSEYLYFEELFLNAVNKLCPDLNVNIGISITNSSGVVNSKELAKLCNYIILDLDCIRGNFFGFAGNIKVAQDLSNFKIWNENYYKDFSEDLKNFLNAFIKPIEGVKIGLKNNRAYKNNFKNFLLENNYDFVLCDDKWTLNAIVNLVNTKT